MSALGLLAAIAVIVGAFFAGVHYESNDRDAKELQVLQRAERDRLVDEARIDGAAAANEKVAEQLRRISNVNRVELTREVTKEVYRCPVPPESQRLLDRAVEAANAAARGREPPPPVSRDPAPADR